VRVVNGFRRVGAEVKDLVPLIQEPRLERFLQLPAGVVGPEGNRCHGSAIGRGGGAGGGDRGIGGRRTRWRGGGGRVRRALVRAGQGVTRRTGSAWARNSVM